MLGMFYKIFYAGFMKRIIYIWLAIINFLVFSTSAFADTDSPPLLRFYAINAGYKDDSSAQNYDFIELERLADSDLSLSPYRIVYTNSSGNSAGELGFPENVVLSSSHLVLGATVNPTFSAEGSYYTYNFGSAGLASTAGKLELYQGEHKIDEICWGKLECATQNPKFATKSDDNYSLVRCDSECAEGQSYSMQKYYPEPDWSGISEVTPDSSESEPSCDGIIISEIFSYYSDVASEQFIELYNPTAESISLELCTLRYKTESYKLFSSISSGGYYLFRNPKLILTKNPTTSNEITIENTSGGIVASVSYPHGQKKGSSYALFEPTGENPFWRQTYFATPGSANIYQEFQSCPSGKVINPSTGNCVKETVTKITTCPVGKYLNPLTNRCKKIEAATTTLASCKEGYERNPTTNRCRKIVASTSSELAPCKDGYERNPETNRCRKIRENVGDATEYAPTPTEEGETYHNPKIFIAIAALIGAALVGIGYVIYQYRQEIRKLLKTFVSRFRKV